MTETHATRIAKIDIGPSQRRVLKTLKEKGRLYGQRLYPFPFVYTLQRIKKETGRDDRLEDWQTITDSMIHKMVIARLIEPEPGENPDLVVYMLTKLGRKVAKSGYIEYEDAQLDWITLESL